jgi:hypothetical protein
MSQKDNFNPLFFDLGWKLEAENQEASEDFQRLPIIGHHVEHEYLDKRNEADLQFDFAMYFVDMRAIKKGSNVSEVVPISVDYSPDNISFGTPVEVVGYGKTNKVEKNVDLAFVYPTRRAMRSKAFSEHNIYSQEVDRISLIPGKGSDSWKNEKDAIPPGGTLPGDSGGPLISLKTNKIIGVTSRGAEGEINSDYFEPVNSIAPWLKAQEDYLDRFRFKSVKSGDVNDPSVWNRFGEIPRSYQSYYSSRFAAVDVDNQSLLSVSDLQPFYEIRFTGSGGTLLLPQPSVIEVLTAKALGAVHADYKLETDVVDVQSSKLGLFGTVRVKSDLRVAKDATLQCGATNGVVVKNGFEAHIKGTIQASRFLFGKEGGHSSVFLEGGAIETVSKTANVTVRNASLLVSPDQKNSVVPTKDSLGSFSYSENSGLQNKFSSIPIVGSFLSKASEEILQLEKESRTNPLGRSAQIIGKLDVQANGGLIFTHPAPNRHALLYVAEDLSLKKNISNLFIDFKNFEPGFHILVDSKKGRGWSSSIRGEIKKEEGEKKFLGSVYERSDKERSQIVLYVSENSFRSLENSTLPKN